MWQAVQAQAALARSPEARVWQGTTVPVSLLSLPRQAEGHSQDTHRTQTQLFQALITVSTLISTNQYIQR